MSATPPTAVVRFTKTAHHDTYDAIRGSDHRGHVVFVSGASRGIGRATALSFARAGASGIVVAARHGLGDLPTAIRDAAREAGRPAPEILELTLDVGDEASVTAGAERTYAAFGRLDVLVNNAGTLETWRKIAESDPDEWWQSWEVNVKGVYLMTRAFLPLLLAGEHKTLVNLSSVGAHRTGLGASAYQTGKLAILRFTEFVCSDHGADGILAFAIHPGGVPTELAHKMPEAVHHVLVDTPELAGDTIAWLTEERREWLAGRYVSANWDMPELVARRDEIVERDALKVRLVT
ncbi:MAG: SDR family oxidoreductase [Polyangiaceae bacterium]